MRRFEEYEIAQLVQKRSSRTLKLKPYKPNKNTNIRKDGYRSIMYSFFFICSTKTQKQNWLLIIKGFSS